MNQHPFFSKQAASHKQTHEQQIKKMAIFFAKQQIEQTDLFLFWDHVATNQLLLTACV